MTPDTISHLLQLAIGARTSIAHSLDMARQALGPAAPGIGSLEADRRVNEKAISELEEALRTEQVAA